MRLYRIQTSLILLTLLGLISKSATAQWTAIGGTNIPSSVNPNYISSAVGSNDTPYIFYHSSSNIGYLKEYDGSSWVQVGSSAITSGDVLHTSLAFDSHDTLYAAYGDASNSYYPTVKKYNGSSWVTVGSAITTLSFIGGIKLAFDSHDTAYVALLDGFTNKPTVMKYNGSSWVTVGSAGFSSGTVDCLNFAIGNNDTPYVAYRETANGNKAKLMQYNGSSWVDFDTTGFYTDSLNYLNMALDTNKMPYIAFMDFTANSYGTVMQYSGGSWATVGSAGFTSVRAPNIIMGINGNNVPYVVYVDFKNSNRPTAMSYDGASWATVGSADFSLYTYIHPSLAFNSNNLPYFSGALNNSCYTYRFVQNRWNGSTWTEGSATDSTFDAYIASGTAPTSFICKDLVIDSGYALNTGTSNTVTIYGDLANNGNGISGTGTLTFTKNDTSTLSGDTVEIAGTVIVDSGCTLTTNSLLRLLSDTTSSGSIGNSAGTISGNVFVQRANKAKRCYRVYAHPFSSSIALSQLQDDIDITGTGGSTNGFTTTQTNASSAYWFDVTAADTSTTSVNSGWTAFTSTNGSGANAWGQYQPLLLYLRGAKGEGLTTTSYTPSSSTFEAYGSVNQGTQTITLTKGTNTTFGACGNPFPSGIQMQNVSTGSSIGSNYYVWDATSGADGAWMTNAFSLSYVLPAYAGFFTTVSASTNNTITIEEQDKASGATGVFKTTAPKNWVELLISDSTTKWDRLLINFDDNAMDVEDNMDAKKLYNPNLDFYTLSKDGARLAIDVRPYTDATSIPLGLTAYNRYNKYVIRTGMYDIPAGTKLVLHDKYLNKQQEMKPGFEYWFDVTSDSLSQGRDRFEINMVGKPTGIITATEQAAQMQLIPNPAGNFVKISFDHIDGTAQVRLLGVTGQVVYQQMINGATGSVIIPLQNISAGIYIAELQGKNARFTQKLIKE